MEALQLLETTLQLERGEDREVTATPLLGLSAGKPTSKWLYTSTHLSLSVLQLSFLLLHPLDEHLPHLVLSPLQLQQELVTLGLIRLLQTATAKFKFKASKELSRSQSR